MSDLLKGRLLFAILLIVACLAIPSTTAAQSAGEPVVQAILFYTPTCPICHRVINEVLMPMVNDYGDRLQIVGVDTSGSAGGQLYRAAIERYQIPPERQGVPTLVIGDVVLVGGREIPEQFPALVEKGLAAGGIGWPDIPGLAPAISEVQDEELRPAEIKVPSPDPMGFALAGVVLAGMVAALGYAAWRVGTARQHLFQLLELSHGSLTYAKTWAIPTLVLVGLGIATYLAYVEITQVEAICGPIGECNFVQSSLYARILGIPVAVLGVLHYLAIGVLWVEQRYVAGRLATLSVLGLLGLTLFGTLFSVYLTCLEVFVVRAICIWCLGSAVTTTILMLLVVVSVTGSPSPK
ncbi:MAG: vitamin K epoxide reductase family protein [Anaerolineae bacterium]